MKNLKLLLVISTIFFSLTGFAKTRLAVSTFKDKSARSKCRVGWFSRNDLGTGFQEQLITKLQKKGRFSIQERTNLKQMYNEEHNLINSDRRYSPRKNQFKSAHYSITGAVTAFELCNQGGDAKVDVGGLFGFKNTGLKVGGGVTKAKVGLDVRIVDVESGEILDSFTVEGSSSSAKFNVDGDYKGSRFGSKAFGNTPLGEATRVALAKAANKIDGILPDRKEDPREVAQSDEVESQTSKGLPNGTKGGSGEVRTQSYKLATKTKYLCKTGHRDLWSMCKLLKKSKSGKRLLVLRMNGSKKEMTKPDQVLHISEAQKTDVGSDVYLTCNIDRSPCSWDRKYGYMQCVVVDSLDSDLVVTCKGREFQISSSDVIAAKTLRKLASKKSK